MAAPTWHGGLPWDRLRQWYRRLRRALFSTPEPTGRPAITTDVSLEELREALGERSWAPNWEYSYHKRGEDLNQSLVLYWADHDHTDKDDDPIVWWQSHVRGWVRDGAVVLRAHWEPEPTEYPQAHLKGVGHDVQRGMDDLRVELDDLDISYAEGDQTAES
jgi:hypothetical protein